MSKKMKAAVVASIVISILIIGTVLILGIIKNSPKKVSPAGNDMSVAPNITAPDSADGGKAFLNDKSFLDEYQPFLNVERDNDELKEVSLLASSVSRDIRLTVVDAKGRSVSGEDFVFSIDGLGEYKDPDKDGYLYIGGVKPGKYTVSLSDTSDYGCVSDITVSVKEKIDYEILGDISYLIKTEKDIDVEAEDPQEKEDISEQSEKTDLRIDMSAAAFGIDVSKWNGEIDWKKVKEAGVEFAIIRCGYRGSKTGVLVEDPYFRRNLKGAKAAGVDVGIYFFTQAINENEAVEEASTVLTLLDGEQIDYPIFIDTEGSGGRADSLDVETRTSVCTTFMRTIESAGKGYKAGVYASRNWFYKKVRDSEFTPYVIWVAEYNDSPKYVGKYGMWQYTSSGSVDGISGRVDFDQSYLVKESGTE